MTTRRVVHHRVDGPVCEVRGDEVQVGDRLMFLGCAYTVDRLLPYEFPGLAPPGTRVAVSLPDWEMTLTQAGTYRIRPRHGRGCAA